MKQHKRKIATDYYEKVFWNNKKLVTGVDEAGRGALAGPVAAAAVILKPETLQNIGITDSKKISAKKREKFFDIIIRECISFSFSFIESDIIDEINVLQATVKAMHNSIRNLSQKPGHLLIDGNYFVNIGLPYTTIVDGDEKSISIASASIIAKVSRDRWMTEVADKKYPEYDFARNKGYGTKKHIEAIKKYGVTPIHRLTFLKNYLASDLTLF